MTDDDPTNEGLGPTDERPDDLFAAAGGATAPNADPESTTDDVRPSPYPDEQTGGVSADPVDPYPDGPAAYPAGPPTRYTPAAEQRPAAPYPEGPAEYPAGPPAPYPTSTPQFGRRQPTGSQRPDADGYYPSDYYVGPDWMRIIVSGLATVVILIAAVAGGTWLWDEFGPNSNEGAVVVEATPTPLPLVLVYECAGDAEPVTEMLAPSPTLIAGRTADSRWLAFRNPQAPPLQLWIRASSVPDFPALDVGVTSCATAPDQFPTSATVPTPVPTIAADPTPTPTEG